jgi:hypothetical protein
VGLGDFSLAFHTYGVDDASELGGCTDAWLKANLGFNEAHLVKFREVCACGPSPFKSDRSKEGLLLYMPQGFSFSLSLSLFLEV